MILMNNFQAEPAELKVAMSKAAERVINSGWFVLGKETEAFERAWAASCQASYGVGVGNGMDAIEIILRALDIGPGDEVVTTPTTAFATVLAVLRSGATPVLADIDLDTGLLNIDSAARCISPKTKAILLVHLYGQMRDIDRWEGLCVSHGIQLIEDCAQSHLASFHGRSAGTIGIAGAYSFYPTKNLGCIGDGGMIVTNNDLVNNRSKSLRNYGQSIRYHHPELGMNSRLDEIQAAILMERLKYLESFTNRRREVAEKYYVGIKNPNIQMMALPQAPEAHVYHLFVVRSQMREALQAHLEKCGVQSLIHYPIPIHQQPPCLTIQRDSMGLENSELYASTCLSIPCHPQLSDVDVQKVIDALNQFPFQSQ